ncbi:hypothetical protein EIP86_010688 [Pleurotus ostreatoroseus]|nr:hypothetical protein EIP86_010688 [Pleurotus ostreatoroseus]
MNIPFQSLHTWSRAGTPGYWAPEVREWDPRKGAKPSSDVYSLGIVILEMTLGPRGMFFAAADEKLINEQMKTRPIPFDQVKAVDADLADMLEKMLCDSPAERWTPEALKGHPYVRDLFEAGLESGLVHPSYFPPTPRVPQSAALVKVEDLRKPHISWVHPADLAYPRPKDGNVSEEYKTLVLDDLDDKTYNYTCPAEYMDITLYGWPAATAQ